MSDKPSEMWVVYDGECPFCSAYVKMVRLREAAGAVHLIDARTPHPVVDEVIAAGYDLDEGMALKIGDVIYHGDECVHRLALMSGGSGLFNKFNHWVFASEGRSRALYPFLRAGRNLALRLLGKSKLADARAAEAVDAA